MQDKKGLMSYQVYTFFRLFILMIVILSVVMLIRLFIVSTVDISQAESEIFYNNLVSSPAALAYSDPVTHRAYPRRISISDFADTAMMEKRLTDSFWQEKPGIAARCALFNITGEALIYNGRQVQPVFYNRQRYLQWSALANARAKGIGGANERIVRQDVLLKWDSNEVLAMLEVSVTVPNS